MEKGDAVLKIWRSISSCREFYSPLNFTWRQLFLRLVPKAGSSGRRSRRRPPSRSQLPPTSSPSSFSARRTRAANQQTRQTGVYNVPDSPEGGGVIKSVEEYQVVKRGREYHVCEEEYPVWEKKKVMEISGKEIKF